MPTSSSAQLVQSTHSQSEETSSQGAVGFSVESDSGIFDTTPCDTEPCSQSIVEHSTNDESPLCDKTEAMHDTRAIQDIAEQKLLKRAIIEHDKSHKEYVFNKTLFNCHVCFLEKLGQLCIKFHGEFLFQEILNCFILVSVLKLSR